MRGRVGDDTYLPMTHMGGARATWNATVSSLFLTSPRKLTSDCLRFLEHFVNSQNVFDLIECLNSVCQLHAFFK